MLTFKTLFLGKYEFIFNIAQPIEPEHTEYYVYPEVVSLILNYESFIIFHLIWHFFVKNYPNKIRFWENNYRKNFNYFKSRKL